MAKTELEDGGSWNVRTGPAVPQVVSDVLCPGWDVSFLHPAGHLYPGMVIANSTFSCPHRRHFCEFAVSGKEEGGAPRAEWVVYRAWKAGLQSPKLCPLPSWLWAVKAVAVRPHFRSPVLTPKPADFLFLRALPSQQRDSHDWPQPKDPGPERSWENEMSPNREATGF